MERGCIDDQTTTSDLSISTGSTPVASGADVTFNPEVEARSRKLTSSRYKGVVPQPNGRWGAQIYEKHQRVWLGTFNEEDEAAKMYDVAVQRFRGGDAVTNFKKLITELEANFLNSHSKSEIVDMLRKHTYNDELEQSKRTVRKSVCQTGFNSSTEPGSHKPREHLFEKTLTPSDVSKLNRLVIPKQYAEKHFPIQIKGSNSKGILLHFEDNDSKIWRFRYSFWNSSQSFVLTRGWSRFVKEKNLKAGDSVRFQCSTGPEKQLYIDWKSRKPVEPVEPVQILRLFGVEIPSVSSYGDKKSNIEIDLLGFRNCKKQRVINAL